MKKLLEWFEENNWAAWLATVVIAVLMFYISSIVFGPSTGRGGSIKAILYHIFAYFFLAFFLSIAIVKGKWKSGIFLSVLLSVLYAISDEYHQLFVTGRSGTVTDVILDTIGVFLAALFYYTYLQYKKYKQSL